MKRACQAARLSRAAYHRPETNRGARDREVIEALNEIVSKELRWGFWKCLDRLRQRGKPWTHQRVHRVLNVIDEADRGCLGIALSTSIAAARVIRFVEQLIGSMASRQRFAATTARS